LKTEETNSNEIGTTARWEPSLGTLTRDARRAMVGVRSDLYGRARARGRGSVLETKALVIGALESNP
jgi:hypothetical protein